MQLKFWRMENWGKWSDILQVRLPLIELYWELFKKILSIRLWERSHTLVGCRISGWSINEEIESYKIVWILYVKSPFSPSFVNKIHEIQKGIYLIHQNSVINKWIRFYLYIYKTHTLSWTIFIHKYIIPIKHNQKL